MTIKEKILTTEKALSVIDKVAKLKGVSPLILQDIADLLIQGIKLRSIVKAPGKFGLSKEYEPVLDYMSQYNLSYINPPIREGVIAVEANVVHGRIRFDGKVEVSGSYSRQSQSALSDVIAGDLRYFKINRKGTYSFARKDEEGAKGLRDMTNVAYLDLEIPLDKGQRELREDQKKLLEHVFKFGIVIKLPDGYQKEFNFLYQTPSQERTLRATFISGVSPVKALLKLGHDIRLYGKYKDGTWTVDISKAMTRFGLSGSNSIPSKLIKIGNKKEYFSNGDLHITGGTHTVRFTKGVYSIVKKGMYKVYNTQTGKFEVLDSSDPKHHRKLAVGDGLIFCDESVFKTLSVEFGKKSSAWQVRITPNTKGLMVFVPELKKIYGSDIVIFDTAAKGNYEALLSYYPDYQIEVRIIMFNEPARFGSKYRNIPYQFLNTIEIDYEECIKIVDKHLDRVFEMYDNPRLLVEYLDLDILSKYEGLSEEELSEEDFDVIKNKLTSRFAEFLYAGEFTLKDPMMKKYAKELIDNLIKEWSYGSIPIQGNYRYMVQDPYAILEAKVMFDDYEMKGGENPLKDEEGDIIVPSNLGLKEDTVFMIDDEDKFMMSGKEAVLNRNPKISFGETAFIRTDYNKTYAVMHEKYPDAFTNLCIFSVHDFNTVKQGGADNDGDQTLVITEPSIVNAVKETIYKYPAVLDISIRDGQFIEGVPFDNPDIDPKRFTVSFTDEEYNFVKMTELYEISKLVVQNKLEKNEIGLMTDYATKLLDAVSKLRICLKENQTLDRHPMSESFASNYKDAIQTYLHYIDILRLVQGWEIDKAKHGGAYKKYMDLRFITDPEYYPLYASYVDEEGRKQWITPEWMQARR